MITGLASVGGANILTGVSVILDQPYGGNVNVNANGGNAGDAVVGAEVTEVGLVVGLHVDGENEGSVEGALDRIVVNTAADEGCLPISAATIITSSTTNTKNSNHPRRLEQQGSR